MGILKIKLKETISIICILKYMFSSMLITIIEVKFRFIEQVTRYWPKTNKIDNNFPIVGDMEF